MRKGEVDRFMRRQSARPATVAVSSPDFTPGRDGLSRPARAVYRLLLVCARDDGSLRFERIGDKRFRDETGYGRTSVIAARKELVAAGLVQVLETGSGRVRSAYTMVVESTAYERELWDAAHPEIAEGLAVAVGAEGLFQDVDSDTQRVELRHPGVQISTPPTRAHPGSSGLDRPYPSGQGPGPGDAAPLRGTEVLSPGFAGAARCPTAASRGKPCASCRACGTNPRALRKAAAAQRPVRVVEPLRPVEEQLAINGRGRSVVEAVLAAKAAARAGTSGFDQGGAAGASSTSAPPGSPPGAAAGPEPGEATPVVTS